MKKFGCLVVILLITQGTVLSMMHGRKIIHRTSRLKLNRSYIELEKQQNKFVQNLQASSTDFSAMDVHSRARIRDAYIASIYKVAQIEAMCKIYSTSNLDAKERQALLDKVAYIVRE